MLANARRGLSAAEVHEATGAECSQRTTYRALNHLSEEHPIERVSGGGAEPDRWRLDAVVPGSDSLPLEPMQVLALAIGKDLLSPLQHSFLSVPLARLHADLRAALTPQARAYADELRASIAASHITPARYGNHEVFAAIEEALQKEHFLLIEHGKSATRLQSFRFAPYATWIVPGRVYLVGRREGEDFERRLAVHRIHRATVLDEPCDRDPSFDMSSFTRRGFGVFHGDVHDIVLDFGEEVAHVAHERVLHESQQLTELDGGGLRLQMRCAGLPEIAAWLAGFGGLVRPVAPDALVQALRMIHQGGLDALPVPDTSADRLPLAKAPPTPPEQKGKRRSTQRHR